MRVTTVSTAALCSLGVIAAYGISNKVNGTPQPETPQDNPKPVAEPSPAPKVAVETPVAQTIAPPTLSPQSISTTQSLTKARQEREARLAENLAKISVPGADKPLPVPKLPTLSIKVPDVKSLPIDKIVSRAVGPKLTAVQPATAPAIRPAQPAQPIAKANHQPQTSAQIKVPANSVAFATPHPTPPQPIVTSAHPAPAAPQATPAQAAQPTTEIASAQSPSATQPSLRVESANSTSQPTMTIASQSVRPAAPENGLPLIERLTAALPMLGTQNKAATPSEPAKPDANSSGSDSSSPAAVQAVQPAQPQAGAAAPAIQAAQPIPQAVQVATVPHAPQPAVTVQTPSPPIYPDLGPIDAATVDAAYTLGPGDRLSLRFFNVPEYNGDVQVLADGTLNLPLVGSISVGGMTLQQAEAEIAARYQSELRYAVVTVTLQQPRPLQIVVAGEVQQPGSYTLSLVEGAQFPSIVAAIQNAGGTTQAADLRNVVVQRSTRTNPNQTIAVNLVDLVRNGNLSQDLKLRDGDRVIIPTATSIDFTESAQLSASNVAGTATQAFDIAVVGEVLRPGAYKMGGGEAGGGRPSISQAIQLAGGVKPSADLRQIQIRRATRTGVEQVINVDFWQLLQAGNLSQDLILQQGDRITIPTATTPTAAETTLLSAANISPATIRVNIVGEVNSPGTVEIPPGSTLNQAILAAGGLNTRATREIELIRLDASGTLSRRSIEVEFKEGFNTSDNPLILNNDIVVVGRSGATQFTDQLNQINGIVGPLLQLIPFKPF